MSEQGKIIKVVKEGGLGAGGLQMSEQGKIIKVVKEYQRLKSNIGTFRFLEIFIFCVWVLSTVLYTHYSESYNYFFYPSLFSLTLYFLASGLLIVTIVFSELHINEVRLKLKQMEE